MRQAKAMGWTVLVLIQLVAFVMVLPRVPRFFGKGTLPILLALVVIATVTYAVTYLGIRGDRALRRRALGTGAGLILFSLAWIAGSLWAMHTETQSMVIGMMSIFGVFFWLPLFLIGSALIVAADRD